MYIWLYHVSIRNALETYFHILLDGDTEMGLFYNISDYLVSQKGVKLITYTLTGKSFAK